MQYAIHQNVIPPELRSCGTRVWVGDSVLGADSLAEQGLHAVFILLLRDVYGEIAIFFAMPANVSATSAQITACRRCALGWLAEWENGNGKPFPQGLAATRRPRQRAQASRPGIP